MNETNDSKNVTISKDAKPLSQSENSLQSNFTAGNSSGDNQAHSEQKLLSQPQQPTPPPAAPAKKKRASVSKGKAAMASNNVNSPKSFASYPDSLSPSGVPKYAKPGLTADQLKLPNSRKRKPSSATPTPTSPEDIRTPQQPVPSSQTPTGMGSSTPTASSPALARRESAEVAKNKLITEKIRKRNEFAKADPLGYFLTCLGETLGIDDEEVESVIGKRSAIGKDSSKIKLPMTKPNAVTKPSQVNQSSTPYPASDLDPSLGSEFLNFGYDFSWDKAPVAPFTIRNAFGSLDTVKSSNTSFRASVSPSLANVNSANRVPTGSPGYVLGANKEGNVTNAIVSNTPDSGNVSKEIVPVALKGLENRSDIDIWQFDQISTAFDDQALKKDYWTLNC